MEMLTLTWDNVAFLLVVGFIGGLVSGFIGSGGAFVLTPAMMSMGVPGVVAVASNICHKFPKALVGAHKRHKYGQVDIKLGLYMAVAASLGMWWGAGIQKSIRASYGETGSNLYVSAAFLIVLIVVGGFVMRDAVNIHRAGNLNDDEKPSRLARWIQAQEIPGTMVTFNVAKTRVSLLFILPLGLATGLLASTIAVGGFVGVPGMMYVLGATSLIASATELVIAFVMGLGGTITYAMDGFVDIRLAMLILLGSLFGIQLGAIGTTFVKPYVIKLVMATIMLIVALSRALVIPVYLTQLGRLDLEQATMNLLNNLSFALMVAALAVGGLIIIGAMLRGHKESLMPEAAEVITED